MPELPEVEVVRRGADKWFVGRRVRTVTVLHPRAIRRHLPGVDDFSGRLAGARICATDRRGKYFWFVLDNGDALVTHLGMSGQLRVSSSGQEGPSPHVRVRVEFDDDRDDLLFIDQRTFGGMFLDDLAPRDANGSSIPASLAHIAADPLDVRFDQPFVVEAIRAKRSSVKAVILDQTVVSGIGNIYADEALWRARLDWQRSGDSISRSKLNSLIDSSREVMSEALVVGGTSFDSLYVNVNGSSGYFSRSLAVYGREGKPCPRCAGPISREHFANRSSFRCVRCQRRSVG